MPYWNTGNWYDRRLRSKLSQANHILYKGAKKYIAAFSLEYTNSTRLSALEMYFAYRYAILYSFFIYVCFLPTIAVNFTPDSARNDTCTGKFYPLTDRDAEESGIYTGERQVYIIRLLLI